MSPNAQPFFEGQRSLLQALTDPAAMEPFTTVLPPRFSETSGGILPAALVSTGVPQTTLVQPELPTQLPDFDSAADSDHEVTA